jgi:hypothetical protein
VDCVRVSEKLRRNLRRGKKSSSNRQFGTGNLAATLRKMQIARSVPIKPFRGDSRRGG